MAHKTVVQDRNDKNRPCNDGRHHIYVAICTDKQEDSPERQQTKFGVAPREGLNRGAVCDGGISGTKFDKRLNFRRQLKRHRERHDFTVILCRDQDHFRG